MTIGVSAKFKGGSILGSDSRLTTELATGPEYDDHYTKIFDVQEKRFAFAIAGDLQVSAINRPDRPILDAGQLILARLDNFKADRPTLVRECFDGHKRIADLVGQDERLDQEVLLAFDAGNGPYTIWKLSRKYRKTQLAAKAEGVVMAPVSGIGVYWLFEQFQRDASKINDVAFVEKLRQLPIPPSIPTHEFASEKDASEWVKNVIEWCCLGIESCGGPAVIVTLP